MADNAIIIIGVIVIIVLAAVALLTISTSGPSSNSSTVSVATTIGQTSPTSIPLTTTTAPIVIAPPTSANASVSKLFINQTEAQALLESSGNYIAYQRNSSQLQGIVPPVYISTYGITGIYSMYYNATVLSATGNLISANTIQETIYPSNAPASLYSFLLAQSSPYFNQTFALSRGANVINSALNTTTPGFTYSTASVRVHYNQTNTTPAGNSLFEILLGYTNHSVTLVSVVKLNSTQNVNPNELANFTRKNLV